SSISHSSNWHKYLSCQPVRNHRFPYPVPFSSSRTHERDCNRLQAWPLTASLLCLASTLQSIWRRMVVLEASWRFRSGYTAILEKDMLFIKHVAIVPHTGSSCI